MKKIPLGAEDGENIKGGREGVRTARLRMVSELSPVVDVTSIPSFPHIFLLINFTFNSPSLLLLFKTAHRVRFLQVAIYARLRPF
jgi:hypothetical protein